MRHTTGIALIILFFHSECEAASGWFASDQVWSIIYFLCAGYGALALNHLLRMPYFGAFFTTFCIAFLKEAGDALYAAGIFGEASSAHPFWDAKGLSLSDLLVVVLSIVLSYPFRKK